jgi:shikimate kinase
MITKLKRTPCLYLVGFMGSGKTTIGRLLADRLGWSFADLDDDIEASAGTPITYIFSERGETEFRKIESESLLVRIRQVERGIPFVIALGGGAFAQPQNYTLIQDAGISIWLDCPLEVLKQRVARADHRPLAKDLEQFELLYYQRLEAYSRADFRIPITCDEPEPALEAVLALPIF